MALLIGGGSSEVALRAEAMGDFWAEWASETLSYANQTEEGEYYEEAAAELLTLANDCYRVEVRLPSIPI